MKNFSFYLVLILSYAIAFSSCKKDEPDLNPADGKTVTIDATDYEEWTYFSFSTGDVLIVSNPETETNWDLGFLRNHIKTNGGTSGSGMGEVYDAGVVSFESVTEAPTAGYVSDNDTIQHTILDFTQDPPAIEVDISANPLLETWGEFDDTMPPTFNVSNKIFVIKTANGNYAKLHFQSYYNADGSGHVTFEYKYQADGSVNLQ
jgi:hypothetical protein